MRKLVVTLIVLSLLLVGCVEAESPTPQTPTPSTPLTPATNSAPNPIILHKEPPEDMTWISPGKINVSNFYPGARAEYEVLVHNGKDTPSKFSITYRVPNQVSKDYVKAPAEAQDWVIIADNTPVIMPKQTKGILVVLDMPEGAVAPLKWEFWTSVIEITQTGSVHTELCCRWLIDMRD